MPYMGTESRLDLPQGEKWGSEGAPRPRDGILCLDLPSDTVLTDCWPEARITHCFPLWSRPFLSP